MAWSATRIRVLGWLGVVAYIVLGAAAAWAENQDPSAASQPWLVPLVGLLLLTASLSMRGALLPRALLALTAVTWLLGSVSVWLLVAHQGVLLLTLLVGVPGRLDGWDRVFATVAFPISLGMLAQPAVGAVFLASGVRATFRRRSPGAVAVASAAGLVGGTLVVSWWVSRVDPAAFDPYAALLLYEAALVAAAGALVLGSRAEVERGRELVDRLLVGAESAGLEGLGAVLADVLRAPGLQIQRPPVAVRIADDLQVRVGDRVVAVVRHPVVRGLDAATRAGIAEAVGLVALGDERRALVDSQVLALRAAQRRTVTAQDEQRTAMAAQMRYEVAAPLRTAAAALDGGVVVTDPMAADAVSVARTQVLDAAAEVEGLVRGAGPSGLGHGQLAGALRDMASRSPVRVDLQVRGVVTASKQVETALYYVCAEALVNVHRHAHATGAGVVLEQDADGVRLTICDDGVGGADARRSGLTGLADRVAMHGGRLRVDSPPGAGTVLTVELPSPQR